MPQTKNNSPLINLKPVILIAPLDWGLGHATRCIPIITHFLAIGCEVIVAAEGKQQALLQHEFSNIRFVPLRGYLLRYGRGTLSTIINIILQIPKVLAAIRYEHTWLQRFVLTNKVDAVISDNRYGLYHASIPVVFITHQLTIKTPFGKLAEQILQSINYRLIKKFGECWVPDYYDNENLSGQLAHPNLFPAVEVKYLGRLSRLHPDAGLTVPGRLLVIISGPEPQRTLFENMMLQQLGACLQPVVLVRGLPGESATRIHTNQHLQVYNHLSANSLESFINRSEIIISRSGYSTVMDVIGLNKKCIFIPTPGQPEQQYLARYLHAKRLCLQYPQHRFSLKKALLDAAGFTPAQFDNARPAGYKAAVEAMALRLNNK